MVIFLIVIIVLTVLFIIFRKDLLLIFSAIAGLVELIKNERLKDQEEPKSLSSMDSVYLKQIQKDFPDININELKREAEKVLLDCYNAVEGREIDYGYTGKIRSFIDTMKNDYVGKTVHFDDLRIHKTVITDYKKDGVVATIHFGCSFEYFLVVDGESIKTQDRAKIEFIYIIDDNEVAPELKSLNLHCPNCNSPITDLGEKKCSYCGARVVELIKRVFVCNDIVRY